MVLMLSVTFLYLLHCDNTHNSHIEKALHSQVNSYFDNETVFISLALSIKKWLKKQGVIKVTEKESSLMVPSTKRRMPPGENKM